DLRRRTVAFVALALLVGVAGGAVMVAAAGARRTNTTLKRYAKSDRPPDVLVNPDALDLTKPAQEKTWAQVDHLPNVVASAEIGGIEVLPVGKNHFPDESYDGVLTADNPDGRLFRSVDRVHFTAGRRPNPDDPHEVVVNQRLARDEHLHVGSQLQVMILN